MKLLTLPTLYATLCLAAPAAGLAHDQHHDNLCDWHGHYYGRGARCYRFHSGFYGGLPFFGYLPIPSFGISFAPEPEEPVYRGARVDDRNDDLTVDVQRALRHNGYYHGEIDGDPGPGTRSAIRQYQYDQHLEVTGRIDRSLLRSLALD